MANAMAIGATARVNADGLRLRSGPSLAAPTLDHLSAGAIVRVTGGPTTADGHVWWQIDASGQIGWSAGEFLAAVDQSRCPKTPRFVVSGRQIWQLPGQSAFFFEAGMTIDADGSPHAYHPEPNSQLGLDFLANAGGPGDWFGVVTDTGEATGEPVIQGPSDPAPGFYVSATSLEDHTVPNPANPRRYVNSEITPFIALPPQLRAELGVRLGDVALVCRRATRARQAAIFADIGPRNHLGEGSIALAQALGLPSSPKDGGAAGGIIYIVFPGSGNGRPRSVGDITALAEARFAAWGGVQQLDACFPAPL